LRTLRAALLGHIAHYGSPPRVVFLRNHGVLVLGQSANEVIHVTAMAEKAAKILLGAAAFGGPNYLTREQAERIERRPDERDRRRVITATRHAARAMRQGEEG
jgi:ribulose-5-phosphate 4-epimerase/fuculose-1-phosphate aldolase